MSAEACPGARMHGLITELYPICRSITGDGVRRTLERVGRAIPLEVHEVPSGTPVLDWIVPDEWNVREAWIQDGQGRCLVDFDEHNLHLMSYSVPVAARMDLDELRPHLHTLPEAPDRIPYRTSYYRRDWGFCVTERQLESFPDRDLEVRVDTTLEPGSLTYGECVLQGEQPEEILVSAHCCHPSLANDNLSGIAVAVELARALAASPRRWTYRFLFAPGTIGALTWLARNRDAVGRIRGGLVLAGVGDQGPPTYKASRRGDALVDRAARWVVARRGGTVRPFAPTGYDERQYGSPGFDLPVGCFMRTPPGEYPEYHTSADDLAFTREDSLADSLDCLLEVVEILEHEGTWVNLSPFGEPQLGRRGLYSQTGGDPGTPVTQEAVLWVLNQSDGRRGLLEIAERAGLSFRDVRAAAAALAEVGLLERRES